MTEHTNTVFRTPREGSEAPLAIQPGSADLGHLCCSRAPGPQEDHGQRRGNAQGGDEDVSGGAALVQGAEEVQGEPGVRCTQLLHGDSCRTEEVGAARCPCPHPSDGSAPRLPQRMPTALKPP